MAFNVNWTQICVDGKGRMRMTKDKWLFEYSLSDDIFVEYEIISIYLWYI